jgi:hypothetical protein
LDIESQIWDQFFIREFEEFGGRKLGELFGFSDMEKVWDRDRFNAAVETLTKGNPPGWLVSFDDFFNQVWAILEGDTPAPGCHGPNLSVNYALSMMRWFSLWVEKRLFSLRYLFRSSDELAHLKTLQEAARRLLLGDVAVSSEGK